jgi:hypothetical protein
LQTISLGWLGTTILLISASWVARIIGMSHHAWLGNCLWAYFPTFDLQPPSQLSSLTENKTEDHLLHDWSYNLVKVFNTYSSILPSNPIIWPHSSFWPKKSSFFLSETKLLSARRLYC